MKLLRIISIILIFISITNCENKAKNKFIDENINNFSSASPYVYIDVKHDGKCYTIVTTNVILYGLLLDNVYNNELSKKEYQKIVRNSIYYEKPIEINEEFDKTLISLKVSKDLIDKYDKIDIIKSGYILSNGRINNNIDRENEKAIIYTLLKKEIKNCYQDCETGVTFVKLKN